MASEHEDAQEFHCALTAAEEKRLADAKDLLVAEREELEVED